MSAPGRQLGVIVLGATGSVGRQSLEVLAAYPQRFRLVGLAAHRRADRMAELIERYEAGTAVMSDLEAAGELEALVGSRSRVTIEAGEEAIDALVRRDDVDVVIAAIVGRAGLESTFAAVEAGKRIALANKESLVMAGELLVPLARECGARFQPVDSEHAAAVQLLRGIDPAMLSRLILTASGGPFRGRSRDELAAVTVQDALDHPNWRMGEKISIDSATMMNKAFEVIEAHWLFGLPPDRISVLLHPESLVHALVELRDGSVLAQMGPADMRVAIGQALGGGELDLTECLQGFGQLDLARVGHLSFQPADEASFPALRIGRQALETGMGAPAVLSVADEILVGAFLDGRIGFLSIADGLEAVMQRYRPSPVRSLEDVLEAGREGERLARDLLSGAAR
ncbi:MAG: 1-deoxy-D-xylulose-5-phosphate reductoisomerase [Deltaproteobacteria bacterium]|nr:1-deoxy-D-xylulose-5-phosphate reductoisomerase [Deltaproteobacteria bacterium]